MTTAFQPNAFQNNAFQIDSQVDTHDGVDAYVIDFWKRKRLEHPVTNEIIEIKKLVDNYNKIREIDPANERIISAVDAYVPLESDGQYERRAKASYVIDSLPQLEKINLHYIAQNKIALERFLDAMAAIDKKIKDHEDDNLLIFLASII